MDRGDALVAVHEKRLRQRAQIAIEVAHTFGPQQDGIRDLHLGINNLTTGQPSSSMEMPITVKLVSRYFCESSLIHGMDALQGTHHVAQKSRSTTLPW